MTIDLRSDTVTRPTDGMRHAMATAEVGDDQYGEDPSVTALEERIADLLGQEAAVFTPTGIMATQVLLRALVAPGSEVVCEAGAHVVAYESGAAAINAQVQFRTLEGDRGRLDAATVQAGLRPVGFPNTEVGAVSVEETTNRGGGAVHGLARLGQLRRVADERGIPLLGDGARLWNALAATGEDPAQVGRNFTALSVCLSKGLGAPVGSLAVGSREVITEARRWRRRFGGAMRQAGVLAAAGSYALDHHRDRLVEDHRNARLIADHLAAVHPGLLDPGEVTTNIVYIPTGARPAAEVVAELSVHEVRIGVMGPHLVRLVTHLDVDTAGCRRAAELLADALASGAGPLDPDVST